MTVERETVVVTGLGATTPLGGDVASTWAAMLEGRSGARRLEELWAEELPVRIAAWAAADPAEVVGRVQARRMDRCEQFALAAAREAWADAGAPEADPERIGVAVTSGIGGIGSTLAAYDTLNSKGWQRISPYTVPMLMPNGSAGWISMEVGARAGAHSVVSACASGAEAVGYGIDMIRSGRADVVVAGGTEAAIMPLNIAAFAVMRAMSTRNDEPERASRPFDKARDGFVLGEGAGMLVLESLSHARQRGAMVHAVAAGAGYSSDAYHIAHPVPDGAGVVAAINRALADARVGPEQVVHVNAHATSTPEGDALEAQALVKALGPAADRRGGHVHQIDDRAPARRGGRHRVRGRGPCAARARGSAHDQPGGPRRRRARRRRHRAEAADQARLRADGRGEQRVRVRRPQRVAGVYRRLTVRLRRLPSSSADR